ncbi:phosphoribosylglycinamide formyltransferase-1 [Zhouia amylolytica]|uniref:Phosphoribosylglycinamide formyltransferase n=2 Tax=Zhouia amylolytica TaxID=376730 RepID=W2UKN5_9FLAO|nr:phosphoribosylglycinamide formyltransferase [Zhouia amylolytica]ETN94720.1 folate-dependent phosphoribosylglycinamide formyltransferase PurN [Zhouia amylolytica AD3]SFS74879.1 phosphoribosylglycinamide formyltransferase-1 [Zhouia amylolytica]
MKSIAILASGSGTNAENIIQYFHSKDTASVNLILSNNKNAKVLDRATNHKIPAFYFNRKAFNSDLVVSLLKSVEPDIIVLAGFLWKIPQNLIDAFPQKIINIHPALLPKYGGKGMYGMHVHHAIVENKEKETGITIHYVNEHYDEGAIIFQAKTTVSEKDTADDVANKVHQLEYEHFPQVIEKLLHE